MCYSLPKNIFPVASVIHIKIKITCSFVQEEEASFMDAVVRPRRGAERAARYEANRESRMFKHKYMEDHLNHLNVLKRWE